MGYILQVPTSMLYECHKTTCTCYIDCFSVILALQKWHGYDFGKIGITIPIRNSSVCAQGALAEVLYAVAVAAAVAVVVIPATEE